jgi:hypothetical protein
VSKLVTKYEATRAGQIDGERRAFEWLARNNPTKSEIETILLPINMEQIVEGSGYFAQYGGGLPSLQGRIIRGRAVTWYENAFRTEFVRELTRAYLER